MGARFPSWRFPNPILPHGRRPAVTSGREGAGRGRSRSRVAQRPGSAPSASLTNRPGGTVVALSVQVHGVSCPTPPPLTPEPGPHPCPRFAPRTRRGKGSALRTNRGDSSVTRAPRRLEARGAPAQPYPACGRLAPRAFRGRRAGRHTPRRGGACLTLATRAGTLPELRPVRAPLTRQAVRTMRRPIGF